MSTSCEIALWWIPQNTFDDKSTLLTQICVAYGVTRPHWVKWSLNNSFEDCTPTNFIYGSSVLVTELQTLATVDHSAIRTVGWSRIFSFLQHWIPQMENTIRAIISMSMSKRKKIVTIWDIIFKFIFFCENCYILIKISLEFISRTPIKNKPTLNQVMARYWTIDKSLSKPMMA